MKIVRILHGIVRVKINFLCLIIERIVEECDLISTRNTRIDEFVWITRRMCIKFPNGSLTFKQFPCNTLQYPVKAYLSSRLGCNRQILIENIYTYPLDERSTFYRARFFYRVSEQYLPYHSSLYQAKYKICINRNTTKWVKSIRIRLQLFLYKFCSKFKNIATQEF